MPCTQIYVAPKIPKHEMHELEGTYIDITDQPHEWQILRTQDGDVIKVIKEDTGELLCHVRRNAIPLAMCETAVRCYTQVAQKGSTNRGVAAGIQHRDRSHASYDKGTHANSAIMGYIDSTHYKRPCRLTAFSQQHMETYNDGLPFIHAINSCFADAVPDAYLRQKDEASQTEFHIKETAFSTVTVNYNFRTAVHRDSGDYQHGFGNLVVCQKDVEGGWLIFPRYRVAVVLETGDFMAMDVHEWHCNTPIQLKSPEGFRLSFVCYLRHRMSACNTVNQRLTQFGTRTKMNTETICREIFELVGENLPEKTVTGTGTNGREWWSYQGRRFHIIYKNRRFIVHDVLKHVTIRNLWPAWEYAKQETTKP